MAKSKGSNTAKRPPTTGSFKKGDSRINRKGQVSKSRLKFNKELRELLIDEGEKKQTGSIGKKTVKLKRVEWLVKSIWRNAIAGESWAVNFIADRVEGKITQPLDVEGDLSLTVKRIITDERPQE